MAFVLRHQPSSVGIILTVDGWVQLPVLAAALQVTVHQLMEVVNTDSKQRFTVSTGRIRAAQGHSLLVEMNFPASTPPEALWHGTVASAYPSIMEEGLLPMGRQFVHLSASQATAETVARRRAGEVVLLEIAAHKFVEAGYQLVQSENGVWLTKHIPALFITKQ